VCGGSAARVLIAAAFQMTYIGIPMIYYGDEVGMAGENDPLCRAGMVWDEAGQDRALWRAYRTLIALRKRSSALRDGAFEPLLAFNGVYAYRRFSADDMVVVVLNPREARDMVRIPAPWYYQWVDILTGQVFKTVDNRLEFSPLPAQSAWVLVPRVGDEECHE
jgi:glycosidase